MMGVNGVWVGVVGLSDHKQYGPHVEVLGNHGLTAFEGNRWGWAV